MKNFKSLPCLNEDIDIPPTKQLKLDFETILMGGKLTDLHINAAQKILKIQFPEIIGLESMLYQMKEKNLTEDSTKNQVQIIHCAEKNHWIIATNVSCEGKDLPVVKVHDSIFHSVDTETRKVVINSFQTSDAKIGIRVIG